MTETDAVEDVAASLVREYLSRKGLKGTLKMMDEEAPRGNMSISNRQALMKELNIDHLMRNNKSQPRPYRAMLEVMTKSFLDDPSVTPGMRSSSTSPENVKQSSSTRTYDPVDRRNGRSMLSTNDLQSEIHTLTSTGHSSSSSQRQKSAEYRRPIAGLTGGRSSHSSSDLVIDDNVESETLLGEGKAALMDRTPSAKSSSGRTASLQSTQPRPRSSVKTRGIGMAGPVCSNIDDSRRKFHKPRNLSAPSKQSDWRDDLQSMPNGPPLANSLSSGPSESGVTRPPVDIPLHVASATDMDSSDLALSKSKKEQLQKVLKADPEKAKSSHHIKKRDKSQFERRDSGEVTVPQEETPAYNVRSSSITTQRPKSSHPTSNGILRKSSLTSLNSASTKMGDLEIGEVDDLDGELADLDLAPRVQSTSRPVSKTFEGFPIDMRSAINLKMLIFGSAAQSFNDEWRYQSFSFSDLPHLMYGMVQKKGGPCGVLAAVQAVILQEMLFIKERLPKHKWDEPSREDRSGCLARALSRILWRAGENRKAVVALEGNKANFDGGSRFKEDGLTEKLTLFTFTELEKLQAFLKDVIRQFELDGHSGVVLALYSAILSRGVDRIVGDMDEPTNKLMGAHGYCTQDMVNLFLTGRAVSNVFNDVMELDSGGLGKPMILRGIAARNDIGLLSLFEHYRSCQVGTYYKTPRYPIWVVCSESHFSVLFSVRKDLVNDWKAERRFDLFYYDGLAKQDEPIKLTIDTTNRYYQPPSDQDLVPPLEHCIRTKWKDAEIDWNGTDPIL